MPPYPCLRTSFPTGVPGLDRILGGGLEVDALTEFYGEGGSGKTVACLQATVRVTEQPAWVVYVDTEGVSAARLEAIAGLGAMRSSPVSSSLPPRTFVNRRGRSARPAFWLGAMRGGSGSSSSIRRPCTYRLAIGENDESGRAELARQLADLLATSLDRAIPVLFTNQVWRNVQDGRLEPLGGTFVSHVAKTIVRFDREEGPNVGSRS